MAITGTKAFTSGEILTANDVNQYLMRGVKVFSSTAVRDAAYGGAGEPVLEQGEAAFITGTNTLQVYGGTADGWVDYRKAGAGQVLQVVSTTKTDTFSTSSTTFVDVTGLTATITPSSTSSLVLVSLFFNGSYDQTATTGYYQLARGGTGICIGDTAGSRSRTTANLSQGGGLNVLPTTFLDSPASTSALTYSVQVRVNPGQAVTMYVNRGVSDSDNAVSQRTASNITVMEISA